MEIKIQAQNVGKKFGKEWIFKNINLEFQAQDKIVILGGNGSGKTTLLQVISGFVSPNQGEINYFSNNKKIEPENIKNYISLAAPYFQLIEEFTLEEIINHLRPFKPFQKNLSTTEIIDVLELEHAKHKLVKQFSSGMKQRLRLGLAILADAPILLLDEPCSNLDKQAIAWYQSLISQFAIHKTIIVCSNSIHEEYEFCNKELDLKNFK
jgi:ABC-type multidrug transport system ATPase subunit